jgi:hypothetical protein
VLNDASKGGVESTEYGTREFAAVDLDGSLLIFRREQG